MEIIYTEITEDLTQFLLERAQKSLKEEKKVYYIVPSSMSFEKEKEILERISLGADTAVFDLLVTRFKQLPYYFDRKEKNIDEKYADIYKSIQNNPLTINEIAKISKKTIKEIEIALTMLEIEDVIEIIPNKGVIRK